ncbi:helix-turn-helix transcriptional regulator [Aliivibrio sifiae]|uniref:AraC family transcriptional regulator n=1 Tax=Aliivibrio sifiae TaxID=566293 RepID=A0A2S7X8Q4_9GAMM|nr:AraC family transcriptional regulator [Aliivibrio sifiae]PQJ87721.1 AraC family transcriptional regulator [Aliivibrio sifiae]GLR73348.1 AraC family transcriptional regulator [Aliivibrio sifiae]
MVLDWISPAQIIMLPEERELHAHEHHQLVIGLKGQSEFEISGESSVISSGRVGVIPSHQQHSFSSLYQSEILVLNFPQYFQDEELASRVNALFINPGYYQLDAQIQNLIQLLVCEIQANLDDHLLSRACSDTIIALLHRHLIDENSERKQNRLNSDVIDNFITQHIGTKITVAQLASTVFLGESQFYAIFKQEFGKSPHQYIIEKRIDYAKLLLIKSNLSIGDIAQQTGFANQSAFSHAFVKYKGRSPSKYRYAHFIRN